MKKYILLFCLVLVLALAGCKQQIVTGDEQVQAPPEKQVPKNVIKAAVPAAVIKDVKCNCTEDYLPVCGYDGITYMNKCQAECKKVSYNEGECNRVGNKTFFPCGHTEDCSGSYVPVCGKIVSTEGGDFIRWETFSNACTACRYQKFQQTITGFTRGECGQS